MYENAKVHCLKCWPEYYEAVATGKKPFEVRNNDRNFKVGDILQLSEYLPVTMTYTGRFLFRVISYVFDLAHAPCFPSVEGYVVLGLEPAPSTIPEYRTADDYAIVRAERERQADKWGDQSGNAPLAWTAMLGEEYGELCKAVNEACFRTEHAKPEFVGYEVIQRKAVHVAAVAISVADAAQKWRNANHA